MTLDRAIVAEVHFDRDLAPERLRALGEALLAVWRMQAWMVEITGLDELLRGECPQHFTKGIAYRVTTETGEERLDIRPAGYDPILVWGRIPGPGGGVDPVQILGAAVPPELGRVTFADPYGGL